MGRIVSLFSVSASTVTQYLVLRCLLAPPKDLNYQHFNSFANTVSAAYPQHRVPRSNANKRLCPGLCLRYCCMK
ncbi:hypothetical protein F5Y19DRAFT_435429 [Xylariaceae sp. FL1651]|nr:hypothetical protein F5Y19DRAFT_435429 [Xylariaceae sp. FL1651]